MRFAAWTMDELVDAFLASLESQAGYSPNTRLAYASDLRVFMRYLNSTLQRSPQLKDLTPELIASFLKFEGASGKRQSTLVRRRATLRSFSQYAVKAGALKDGIQSADAKQVLEAIQAVPPGVVETCLTDAQVDSVLAVMETSHRPRARRDQAILLLLLETGLSAASLVELDLSDVDLQSCLIYSIDEGGRVRSTSLGRSGPALVRYLQEGRPELNHTPDEKALFISQMSTRLSRQGLWQILRYWGSQVEPPIHLSPRLVRNTAALRMCHSGRPVKEIQGMLGHANILSTHALIRRLRAVDQIDDPLITQPVTGTMIYGEISDSRGD